MIPVRAIRNSWRMAGMLVGLWLVLAGGPSSAQTVREEVTIYVNEITTWSPGYAMGDIVLGSPTNAGYEPTNGRRQLMLRGKKPGRTTLNVWDQKKVLRHEISLIVTTREAETVEADLRELLGSYPNVQISRLGGSLMLTGSVASNAELAAVNNIARVAKAQSAVTVAGAAAGTRAPGMPAGTVASAPGATPAPGSPAPDAPAVVEYELELFEASTQFKTGDYGRGVEPSGRSLYKGTVRAPIGGEGEVFIGGVAMDPKAAQSAKGKDKAAAGEGEQTGIRLTVRPQPGRTGLVTAVEVETNVPVSYDLYDPEVWRRSRYTFSTVQGVPFALSGNDLLAAPSMVDKRGNPIRTASGKASTASRLPGPQRTGLQYVPVFGSLLGSNSYKARTTQLLVVFRPTLTAGDPQP